MIKSIINRIIRRLRNYKKIYCHRELRVSYGNENIDKTFYIIGVDYDTQGLLAIVKNVLVHIEYAIEKGYIPIVDMQNYSSQFQIDNTTNVWELFFLQPKGYGLEDIKKSRNIIISRNIDTWLGHSIFLTILDDKNMRRHSKLKNIYQSYIRPNCILDNHIRELTDKCIGGKKNILGVLCRGSDYTQKRPQGHPIQPTFGQLAQKVDEYLDRHEIDFIYVATEDEEYLEKFKNKYGKKVLYIDQQRFGNFKVEYISQLGIEHNDLIKLNMDYYASLNILSKCDYLIAGRTAGTIGVSFLAKEYKEYYYFKLGYYK